MGKGIGRQQSLQLYGAGIHKTKASHLRYHAPKRLKNKYVHRIAVERCLEETCYSVIQLLPWPYEVHHMDYNKENNQPGNLLLLDEALHSVLTAAMARNKNGTFTHKFKPKWKLPEVQDMLDRFEDSEVPF